MRVSGAIFNRPNTDTMLTAWPVKLTRDDSLYTLHIGTRAGPLLLDFEAEQLENLHHAITMLMNFPRVTHIDFPLERKEQKQPEELSLDMPLA